MGRLTAMVAGICMLIGMSASVASAAATPATPGVIPPSATPHGKSYGDWSAAWWRWAYQTPIHGLQGQSNPLVLGDGPIDCSYGQSGSVWFLAGTYQSSVSGEVAIAKATRTCTIPAGITLMLATINSVNDNAACPPNPPTTFDEDYLRRAVKMVQDGAHSMFATIDGRSVSGIAGPDTAYRVVSPLFQYTLPSDNLFSTKYVCNEPYPASQVPIPGAVADGVYVILEPLKPGIHLLHWGGLSTGFQQDITYTITVAANGQ